MGKPLDEDDGFRMLSALKNDVHYVVTGVAMVVAGCQKCRVFADVTKVFFKEYSDEAAAARNEVSQLKRELFKAQSKR